MKWKREEDGSKSKKVQSRGESGTEGQSGLVLPMWKTLFCKKFEDAHELKAQ